MEQADESWMCMKRRQILNSSSWEERAFAEDHASGLLGLGGSCIWPPRSYYCSFCKREFRSAQALGGHMNVHRRDRARLKQSNADLLSIPPPPPPPPTHHHNLLFQPHPIIHTRHPPFKSFMDTHFPSRDVHNFMFPYSSSIIEEHHKRSDRPYNIHNNLSAGSHSFAVRLLNTADSTKPDELVKNPIIREVDSAIFLSDDDDTFVETDLLSCGDHHDGAIISCKRHKISSRAAASVLPFLIMPCSSNHRGSSTTSTTFQSQVIGLEETSSMEDIDLELRLGDTPKTK